MRDDRRTRDYEIGYGKPPEGRRFQPGVSGNPSGRPKKPSDDDSRLIRELNAPLTIHENGKKRVITKMEAIYKQLTHKAALGNISAARLVFALEQPARERYAAKQLKYPNNPYLTANDLTDDQLAEIILREERKEITPKDKVGRKSCKRRKIEG